MFYLIFILLILCFFIVASALGHEYGHWAAAKICGWKTHGLLIKWYGAAYKVEVNKNNPEDIWKIALGGLVASTILFTAGLWLSLISPMFMMLAYINFFIILTNIIPWKGLDGYYLWQRITARFRRPNEIRS